MISLLYSDIIYRPILNLLIFFYNILPGHDMGVVIIVITLIIRLILAPSMQKSLKGQRAMNELQPKLNEIREKYKNDKEAQAKATMQLYKDQKINPLASCLPVLIQLPILIGLYQALRLALGHGDIAGLYSYIHKPTSISPYFLHLVDLSRTAYNNGHWYILALIFGFLAGAAQFWQSKMMLPKTANQDPTARVMAMQTTYVLPLLSVFISLRLPAGLPLYWIITTLFAVGQQYYIMRQAQPQAENT